MTKVRCNGFTVHQPSSFYPIHYSKWKRYFETKDKDQTMKTLNKSLAIHVWNKLSREAHVTVGSKVPYAIVAEKYCPKVYSNCGTVF